MMVKWFTKNKQKQPIPSLTQKLNTHDSSILPKPVATTNLTDQQKFILRLPVFGGQANQSFDNFTAELENKCSCYTLTEAQKLEILISRLYGQAADELLKHASSTTQLTWKETISILARTFPEPQATTFQHLRRRKQREDETLEAYAADIRTLVNKFYNNNNGYNQKHRDNEMVKLFISNATPKLKKYLKSQQNFGNIQQVLQEALKIPQS
jgi:hypothetical protein